MLPIYFIQKQNCFLSVPAENSTCYLVVIFLPMVGALWWGGSYAAVVILLSHLYSTPIYCGTLLYCSWMLYMKCGH